MQKNIEAYRLKRFDQEMLGFTNCQHHHSGLHTRNVEEYLSKMEELANKSEFPCSPDTAALPTDDCREMPRHLATEGSVSQRKAQEPRRGHEKAARPSPRSDTSPRGCRSTLLAQWATCRTSWSSYPPDIWQQRLLDVVDSGKSALVVAANSLGDSEDLHLLLRYGNVSADRRLGRCGVRGSYQGTREPGEQTEKWQ